MVNRGRQDSSPSASDLARPRDWCMWTRLHWCMCCGRRLASGIGTWPCLVPATPAWAQRLLYLPLPMYSEPSAIRMIRARVFRIRCSPVFLGWSSITPVKATTGCARLVPGPPVPCSGTETPRSGSRFRTSSNPSGANRKRLQTQERSCPECHGGAKAPVTACAFENSRNSSPSASTSPPVAMPEHHTHPESASLDHNTPLPTIHPLLSTSTDTRTDRQPFTTSRTSTVSLRPPARRRPNTTFQQPLLDGSILASLPLNFTSPATPAWNGRVGWGDHVDRIRAGPDPERQAGARRICPGQR